MCLNRTFRIVYQPYDRGKHGDRRRFGVGAKSLHKYITEKNAKTCIQRALDCPDDKIRIKLRAHGIIDFYYK